MTGKYQSTNGMLWLHRYIKSLDEVDLLQVPDLSQAFDGNAVLKHFLEIGLDPVGAVKAKPEEERYLIFGNI